MTPEREKEIRDYLNHPWDMRNDGNTYREDVNLGRELLAEIDRLRGEHRKLIDRNIQLSARNGERTRMICDLRERLCKIDEAVKKNVGGAW